MIMTCDKTTIAELRKTRVEFKVGDEVKFNRQYLGCFNRTQTGVYTVVKSEPGKYDGVATLEDGERISFLWLRLWSRNHENLHIIHGGCCGKSRPDTCPLACQSCDTEKRRVEQVAKDRGYRLTGRLILQDLEVEGELRLFFHPDQGLCGAHGHRSRKLVWEVEKIQEPDTCRCCRQCPR